MIGARHMSRVCFKRSPNLLFHAALQQHVYPPDIGTSGHAGSHVQRYPAFVVRTLLHPSLPHQERRGMSAPSAPSSTVDTLVERGVAAVKHGDHQQALALFIDALQRDPHHEIAWLWLSGAVTTDAERRYCLEQVVAINPQHPGAQLGLAYLPSDAGSRSPLAPTMKSDGRCTEPGCAAPVSRPGHTLCYRHWKAQQQGGSRASSPVQERITASTLGERYGLSSMQLNAVLAELGWISRDGQGWQVTAHGQALGGMQQVHPRSRVPFVVWPPTISDNRILHATIQSFRGESLPSAAEVVGADRQFRDRFPAQHRTTDGHLVRSKAELLIDNWLYMAGIVHAYERQLPIQEEVYCDFYLPTGKVYVEYWGLEQDAVYAARKQAKRALYAKYQLQLIELTDAEIRSLDDCLPKLLLRFGITVS